jgi:hypothetical protein
MRLEQHLLELGELVVEPEGSPLAGACALV